MRPPVVEPEQQQLGAVGRVGERLVQTEPPIAVELGIEPLQPQQPRAPDRAIAAASASRIVAQRIGAVERAAGEADRHAGRAKPRRVRQQRGRRPPARSGHCSAGK